MEERVSQAKILTFWGQNMLLLQFPCCIIAEVKEYCQFDSLNISCNPGKVVVIETAMYGRMKTGKCVKRDYGHVGCGLDVTRYLSSVCSGRQSCKFEVPDKTLKDMRPCPVDFASYLAVSYTCLSGKIYVVSVN